MGQRVLLLNLPTDDYSSLDLGLTTLATYLNAHTPHRASILDLIWHRKDWPGVLAYELAKERPDWVGISTNKLLLPLAREVIRLVRREGYRVVVGGHQASVDPAGTLLATGADVACTGDGETSLVPMLDRAEQSPKKIQRGSFLPSLDDLPLPDYSLWKHLDRYIYLLGSLYAIGGRGCPYACLFCDAHAVQKSVGGRYFRLMDPRRYAWQLAALARQYKPPLFQLFDPVLSVNADWVDEFCAAYGEYGERVPFSAFARLDNLDDRRIKALAWAGCRILRVGVEAGNEHIRRVTYGKDISTAQIRETVRLCKQHGIALTSYIILGGPGETPATLRESIRLAWELDCERQVWFTFKLLTDAGEQQAKGCGARIRLDGADNISFGTQLDLPGLPGWKVQAYQYGAYSLTFGRRLMRLLRQQKLGYAQNFIRYMARGLSWGLDAKYLAMYYQVYGEGNRFS